MAYTQELMWAAAAYGFRMPNEVMGPRKHSCFRSSGAKVWHKHEIDNPERKHYATMALANPDLLAECDYELGNKVRDYHYGKLVTTRLTREYYAFEKSLADAINNEEPTKGCLGLFVSQVPAYFSSLVHDDFESDIFGSDPLGKPGDKVKAEITVISSTYSHNWNTYYIKAITADKRGVFFSHKKSLEPLRKYHIVGKMKRFDSPLSRLNYVKVTQEIA